jgi:hypothetical protein
MRKAASISIDSLSVMKISRGFCGITVSRFVGMPPNSLHLERELELKNAAFYAPLRRLHLG